MGWGVDDHQIFSQIVERCSRQRVLNAAISSYGTVRELMILSRLDTSKLKWLVLQYCPNDVSENKTYVKDGRRVKTMTEARYLELVAENSESTRYFLGKHTTQLLPLIARSVFGRQQNLVASKSGAADPRNEATWFLEALQGNWNLPTDFRLIVFEVNKLARNDSVFVDSLREEILAQDYPRFIEEMVILDFSGDLDRSVYLAYDGHMSAKGHQVIANRICALIASGNDDDNT